MRAPVFVVSLLVAAAATTALGREAGPGGPLPDTTGDIVHLLNRAAFGPRPGDVERVRRMGMRAWIDEQLAPARIDDSALQRRLDGLETLRLSTRELAERYYLPAMRERRERQLRAASLPPAGGSSGSSGTVPDDVAGDRGRARPPTDAERAQREATAEIVEQKLLRAILSERQLQEVLVDFWFNHFNVSAGKGPTRLFVLEYERDAIRPYVLGRFRDLLGATARSPAMLFYLDNWMNSDPDAPAWRSSLAGAGQPRRLRARLGATPDRTVPPQARPPRGINENYARELLELHTLGVDGGYSQQDVTEIARVFTGWTIENPRQGGSFVFRMALHDDGEKHVLGVRLAAHGGQGDGERVLDLLSRHPSTAHFISTKLACRFVSDEPPPSLVDRMAETFRRTDGDLRAVVRTLLLSPEFLADRARHAKIKTPFEFVVSAVRATGAAAAQARPLARALRQLGMPLYLAQAPTGYSEANEAWMNAGALLARMNVALALATGRVARFATASAPDPGASGAPWTRVPAGAGVQEAVIAPATAERVIDEILHGEVSATTRATMMRATRPEQIVALALGSPEFQRR